MRLSGVEATRSCQEGRREEEGEVGIHIYIFRRSGNYYQRRVAKDNIRRKAVGLPELTKINQELVQYGY